MTENAWLLAASLTFAASVHCVGMCGGFILAVGALRSARAFRLFVDQLLLQIGKATTYAFLGALAGAFGQTVLHNPYLRWGERGLALLAAIAMGLAGLTMLGLRGQRVGALTGSLSAAWSRFVGPLLENRPFGATLPVGLAMGLLPCPLVYAGLAAAAASGHPGPGAAILAGVALGTVPALTAVALFGAAVPARARTFLARAGGAMLIVVAATLLVRSLDFRGGAAEKGMPGCPLCARAKQAPAASATPRPGAPAPTGTPTPAASAPAPPADESAHPH